jgi:hypothetical protein
MTSSPCPIPSNRNPHSSAAVADAKQATLSVPTKSANSRSSCLVLGPVVIQPLRSVSTTSSISACVISGGEKGITSTLDELKWKSEHSSVFFPREWRDGEHPDRKRMIQAVKDANKNYIIIDGEVYSQTAEPRYDITTFGLGHNHGGTGLFVTYHYNPNISKDRYFSALQGDEAVAYANLIAARRGDTDDVGKFEKMIEVHMPELVKVKPNKQHGDGNKLMNDLESLIQGSSSAAEAGLLCMAFAAAY